jgi:exodeoxyribonuclease VII large subunit
MRPMSSIPLAADATPRPYTVSELLTEVRGHLRGAWRDLRVVGEIGRWDLRGGHGYFTLKDRASSVSAIMFSTELERLPFKPQPGLEVVVRGSLDLWPPQGRFQIRVMELQPVGAGALQLAFEQLKARLAAEGLFDPARKRRIPLLPSTLALVTSPAGAAVRDMLNVLSRRASTVRVTIYPVRVQGDGASLEIADALDALNRRGAFDVLILARGGGSAEDLAPFNSEWVARALARSHIPTISAVGHETDFTIADLVADLRAATPSAAAEMVAEKNAELCRRVANCKTRLARDMRGRLGITRARIVGLSRAEGLLRFRFRLRERRDRLAQSRTALAETLERRPAEFAARLGRARGALADFLRVVELRRRRETVAQLRVLLLERSRGRMQARREQLRGAAEKLAVMDPLAVLARGYAVAYKEGARTALRSSTQVKPGERIRVRLHEGELGAVVRDRGVQPDQRKQPGPLFAERGLFSEEEPS